MGEILVVNDISTILYIVFVVTFGLAVLSMCADLAASELKWLFLKIHYFGRRIKRRMKTYEDVRNFPFSNNNMFLETKLFHVSFLCS